MSALSIALMIQWSVIAIVNFDNQSHYGTISREHLVSHHVHHVVPVLFWHIISEWYQESHPG